MLPPLSSLGSASSKFLLALALLDLITPAVTVKHDNFKTCSQSAFCRRNRAFADAATAAGSAFVSPYELNPESITFEAGKLGASIFKTVKGRVEPVELPLSVVFLENGITRVTIDEKARQKGEIELRGDSKARKERYNEAEKYALSGPYTINKAAGIDKTTSETTVSFGPNNAHKAIITHKPFGVRFVRDGETHVILNERNFMNVEHWRAKPENEESEDHVDGGWDETFGGNTDTKPRGPESVGLDITFPGYEHVYGIPEHATSLSLKETRGGEGNYDEPYRLYNADVFEYITDSPMTLYGAIPFMQAHKKGSTVGVFWLNSAETWVDVVKQKANMLSFGSKGTTQTHWWSESGLLDVFVFLGPNTKELMKSYGELTGFTALPQEFAIAYHQCRWNYVSQEDVKEVDKKFDKNDIPYDVIWLDIEYTDGKKYFTFDPLTFGDPKSMGKNLAKRERKLVVIIDPHIKNTDNYPVVQALKDKGLAVKNKDGNIYEGWCWPGSSHWIDCFNPAAIEWWKTLFKLDAFKGTLKNTFIWNDMNEPSVFNGPETTMPKDNLHHDGWEHRDLHNINGMTFMNATAQALESRLGKGKEQRSFVLTRSFFAGAQRLGAMWTGDNEAKWPHLKQALPMLLANGIAGMPFAGADVGGFFGNPSKELLTRWYQAGAFYPFFRGHAHIDAKRREPYIAGEPYTSIMRDAIRLRYALLPAWYTAFHQASIKGLPIIRPHYLVFPEDEAGFAIDDQIWIGDTGLLHKPVVDEGATTVDVYFPDTENYYDYFDFTTHSGKGYKTIDAPLEKIPLFMRGGHIFPRRDRQRRSSGLMKFDPFTLVVALDTKGNAEGLIYLDDGASFDYQKGSYIHRTLTFDGASKTLKSTSLHPHPSSALSYLKRMKNVRVQEVVIIGASAAFGTKNAEKLKVKVKEGKEEREVTVKFYPAVDGKADYAVVRDPKVGIGRDWEIGFA